MNAPAASTVPPPTEKQILTLFPKADRRLVAVIASGGALMKAAGILANTSRLAMFLAQFGHETRGLRDLEENLNYSADRLMVVWPTRFPTLLAAQLYAHKPEALANIVYGGRMGNRRTGDGWTYRGRGAGLTGRDAYAEVAKITGQPFETNPDLAATPEGAFTSAVGIWTWKGLNPSADLKDVRTSTRKLNGGLIGLIDRQSLYALAVVVLNG